MGGLRSGSTVPSQSDFYRALGANLARVRTRAGLTQQDVADGLECSRSFVCLVETGRSAMPIHRLVEWCELLCVKLGAVVPRD